MVLYDSLGSGPQVLTVTAGPLGWQEAAGRRLRNRGETPAPAALWASPAAGLAGFREPLCSPPSPRCWDLQVPCALFPDPLYPTFRLATTSLFSWRAGRVPACGRDLCKLLGARSHPHTTPNFSFWPLCRSLWGKGSLLYPSHVSRSPGNRKLETASSRPSDISAPATGGLEEDLERALSTHRFPPGCVRLPPKPPIPL